jgi:hypothetical protein
MNRWTELSPEPVHEREKDDEENGLRFKMKDVWHGFERFRNGSGRSGEMGRRDREHKQQISIDAAECYSKKKKRRTNIKSCLTTGRLS